MGNLAKLSACQSSKIRCVPRAGRGAGNYEEYMEEILENYDTFKKMYQ